MNAQPRPWKPIVGVEAARIRSELDLILNECSQRIFDSFKANGVPANEWMPRLIQTLLGGAAGATQHTARSGNVAFTREMWRDFALEVWDGTAQVLYDLEAKKRA